jgi:hypothetical protein
MAGVDGSRTTRAKGVGILPEDDVVRANRRNVSTTTEAPRYQFLDSKTDEGPTIAGSLKSG